MVGTLQRPRQGAALEIIEMQISRSSFALRPMRWTTGKDELVLYTAITFPENPTVGCELYLRRAAVCGGVQERVPDAHGLDVLDKQGDILHTFALSREAFEYLRKKLKCRVER